MVRELTTNKEGLETYLQEKDWLNSDESIVFTEKPGEGNMNFTLRIKTENRSFILKQSRDFVEKYPQVAAPEERVLKEAEFYEITTNFPDLKEYLPKILGLDTYNHVMLLEDLGEASDYTFLYQQGKVIEENELESIMDFVSKLHQQVTTQDTGKQLANRKMRKLNHEHIFQYPYIEENGINLDGIVPGLQEIANSYKKDETLKKELKILGDLYLKDGETLLHGDYFPGSWLKTAQGTKIIDPEFCFFGFPEFEIGVTIAHLKLANQPVNSIENALSYYKNEKLDHKMMKKFASVEILRRILGLAQLPLEINLNKRKQLLEEARATIVN